MGFNNLSSLWADTGDRSGDPQETVGVADMLASGVHTLLLCVCVFVFFCIIWHNLIYSELNKCNRNVLHVFLFIVM